MSVTFDQSQIVKAMFADFRNQIETVLNLYGDYNADTLSLLDDADFFERFRQLRNITAAYVSLSIEMILTEAVIIQVNEELEACKKAENKVGVEKWNEHLKDDKEWLAMNEALFKQAQAQYALYRPIAMVEAFEGKKKRGSVLGTEKGALRDLVDKVKGKKKAKGGPTLDPDAAFQKGLEGQSSESIKPDSVSA